MRRLSLLFILLSTVIVVVACSNKTEEVGNIASNSTNSVSESTPLATSSPTPVELEPEPTLSVEPDIPSLAAQYEAHFPIGAAIEPYQTTGVTSELIKKHINILVAENAMKPVSLQPMEGRFNFIEADKIIQFAKDNNMQVRFHTLVWHTQVGKWFFIDENGQPMVNETDEKKRLENKALLLERLETHVKTIVERYKDDIEAWDVVNEVIEPNDPDGMRASEWYKITGTDYIEVAFRAAREAGGPDIKLYINDYSTDNPVKRDRLYTLVKEMLDKGVPIDGVGHQTHISVEYPPVSHIIDSIEMFAQLGLDNIITELDMSLYAWNDRSDYGDDIPSELLEKQAKRYGELFTAFIDNKDMISEVTLWGISDLHTWLSGFPITRTEAPLLFDTYFHAKPAFWSVIEAAEKFQ